MGGEEEGAGNLMDPQMPANPDGSHCILRLNRNTADYYLMDRIVAPSNHVRVVPTKAPSGGPTDIRPPFQDFSSGWAPKGPR